MESGINIWDMSLAGVSSGRPTAGRSRVGVLDRSVAVLDAVQSGARTFTDIVHATGLTRSTAHRLIGGLEAHGFLTRIGGVGYWLGPRLLRLASVAARDLPLRDLARPALEHLAVVTGESAHLFVRSDDLRVCVDAVESANELRATVAPGAELPLTAGSAGKVLMAWAPDADRLLMQAERVTERTPVGERLERQLHSARRLGWAESAGERQLGVGSVSAPVFDGFGNVVAAVSLSGPAQRLGPRPGRRYAPAVMLAAREIERALGVS